MKFTIQLAKVPVLSWFGIRNPYQATVLDANGASIGRIRKVGATSTLTLILPGKSEVQLTARKQGSVHEITDQRNLSLAKVWLEQNTITLLEPALGELDNSDFGCWSGKWGVTRISTFRLSIEIDVVCRDRTGELILIGYLSYFIMSRIGH